MVEVNVALRSGEVMTVYANDFKDLDKMLVWEEVVQVTGRTITLNDLRQGKDDVNWQSPK